MISTKQRGFTIIELLIATSVFSVVLLICTAAILQLGRTYHKGIITSRTQEVARTMMTTISESLQFSGGEVFDNLSLPGTNIVGFCVDHFLFSYEPNHLLTDAADDHGIVVLDLDAKGEECSGSTLPQDVTAGNPVDGRELLQPQMRPIDVSIKELNDNLYSINVTIASGTNDLIDKNGDNVIDSNDAPFACRGSGLGSQFCAVTTLNSLVQRRVQ